MAARGENVHGEADLVEWLARRTRTNAAAAGAAPSVLDAGCGTGRVGIELARRGFDVVGVDLDVGMLAQARAKAPELRWVEGDLASVDLGRPFDAIVMAGNVMVFLAPGTEPAVVANLARQLAPGGVLVAGFQLGGTTPCGAAAAPLDLAAYDRYAEAAGLRLDQRWATWDRRPYEGGSYAVSVHRPA
jgi:SAM-dependent methyltransferase